MPNNSMRELLVREAHSRGLIGYFGVRKTFDALNEYFFWPKMKRGVERVFTKCIACRKAKVSPHSCTYLYLF